MSIEVVMSCYQDPHNLKPVLEGYLAQTDPDFSICVADDGSGPSIKLVIEAFQQKGLKIRHVWHEDLGFRRTVILNKAIASSQADRIVCTDSDCIPSPYFIEDHKAIAKRNVITTGPRVLLRENITAKLHENTISLKVTFTTLGVCCSFR